MCGTDTLVCACLPEKAAFAPAGVPVPHKLRKISADVPAQRSQLYRLLLAADNPAPDENQLSDGSNPAGRMCERRTTIPLEAATRRFRESRIGRSQHRRLWLTG